MNNDFLAVIAPFWDIIVGILIILVVAVAAILIFLRMPQTDRISKIQIWLLYAVTKAEEELGSGTGEAKLLIVYNAFLTKFPIVSKFVPFSLFKILVDRALEEMEKMLSKNPAIKEKILNGEICSKTVKEVIDAAKALPEKSPEPTMEVSEPKEVSPQPAPTTIIRVKNPTISRLGPSTVWQRVNTYSPDSEKTYEATEIVGDWLKIGESEWIYREDIEIISK